MFQKNGRHISIYSSISKRCILVNCLFHRGMLLVVLLVVGELFGTLSMPEDGFKNTILQAQFHCVIDQYQKNYLAIF